VSLERALLRHRLAATPPVQSLSCLVVTLKSVTGVSARECQPIVLRSINGGKQGSKSVARPLYTVSRKSASQIFHFTSTF